MKKTTTKAKKKRSKPRDIVIHLSKEQGESFLFGIMTSMLMSSLALKPLSKETLDKIAAKKTLEKKENGK